MALETGQTSGTNWYDQGVLLNELGRKEEAEDAYRQALKADPKYAQAWSNLGVLLDDQGRKEEAEDAYRQALEARPEGRPSLVQPGGAAQGAGAQRGSRGCLPSGAEG